MKSRNRHSFAPFLLSAAMAALVACASDAGGGKRGTSSSGGANGVDSQHYCDDWAAQCPGQAGADYSWCATDCEQGQAFDSEDCWSTYCSLETGRCYADGEQSADNDAVLECAAAHGWN